MTEQDENDSSESPNPNLEIPEDVSDEPDMDEWWSWSNFARLFIVPFVIVVLAVVIYGFFQWIVTDHRALTDYIRQIKAGTERTRWRAAYDLAQAVQAADREKELTLTEVKQIVRLYRQSEESRVRMYLARVLGEIPTSESRDALVMGLDDSEPGVRVNSLLALGRMQASSEVDEIIDLLDDENTEVRRMAAYVLGSLGNSAVIGPLKSTLDDSVKDVRWNGAIALARLGDTSGKDILIKNLQLAERGELAELDSQSRANLLVSTIKALEKIKARDVLPLLKKLKQSDPAPPVREQALETIETLSSIPA